MRMEGFGCIEESWNKERGEKESKKKKDFYIIWYERETKERNKRERIFSLLSLLFD